MSRRVFGSTAELSKCLAGYIVERSVASIDDHGFFSLALSGGSLPSILGSAVDQLKEQQTDKWRIFFADERCVPLDNDDSNYKAVNDAFLSKLNIPEKNVFTIDPEQVGDSDKAARSYEQVLHAQLGSPASLDLVLLGMGPDGHTCSLFPGHALLDEKERLVASLDDSPKPPPSRITLTYKALATAKSIAFVCTGGGKADTIKSIFSRSEEEHESLPAARVKAKDELVWFLDAPAASKLD
eukprot:m.6545 g.6545  ORF g.6545 m.6545 type:complete len:240 (+) comp4849_c0_seq1:53-772(+)